MTMATDLHVNDATKAAPGSNRYELKDGERFVEAPVELELNEAQLNAGADEMAELTVVINANKQKARDAAAAIRKEVKEQEARRTELAKERQAHKRTITMQCVEVTNFPNDKRIVFPHPGHPNERLIGQPIPLTNEELQTPLFDEDGVITSSGEAAPEGEPAKRGPGRPKGSKNKGTHKPGTH